MNKKGAAFIWLAVMLAIFGMGLLYLLLNQPYERISDTFSGNFTGTIYEPTYNKMQTIWKWYPAIALVGFIIYGILSTLRKREQDAFI